MGRLMCKGGRGRGKMAYLVIRFDIQLNLLPCEGSDSVHNTG
jgi:hypothetical protein